VAQSAETGMAGVAGLSVDWNA